MLMNKDVSIQKKIKIKNKNVSIVQSEVNPFSQKIKNKKIKRRRIKK